MKSHPIFEKLRIFAPGPTPVPDEIRAVLSLPPLHHRTKEFSQVLKRVKTGLKFLFQTQQEVYVFSSSGTGAMEASLVNLFSPGDTVLVVNGGKFGERWVKMSQKFGLETQVLQVDWGRAVKAEDVRSALQKNPKIRAVLFQSSESSTGVAHPVQEIAQVVRENSDALVIVDAITALGVTDLPMDKWQLDAVIGGSQKAQMLPPGLSFLALSERAHLKRKTATLTKFYFNLDAEDKAWAGGETAWTPAVSLVCGLDLYLERVQAAGLEPIFKFYDRLARSVRLGMEALDLPLMAKASPSPAVTSVGVPSSIADGKKIVSHLRDRYGITITGGQDQWKGKVFRLGHLGFYDEIDILTVVSAVELTLKKLGHSFSLGAGVGAVESFLLETE